MTIDWYELLLQLFFTFIGVLAAVAHINSRRSNITISVGKEGGGYFQHIKKNIRFIHLSVTNDFRKNIFERFYKGDVPSLLARVDIDFLDPKTNIALFHIQGRWSSTPEPLLNLPTLPLSFDPGKAIAGEVENILPGEAKELTIGVKVEGNDHFAAFNNWSYNYPEWTNPDWVIKEKTIKIKATFYCDNVKISKYFGIVNSSNSLDSFKVVEI